MSNRLGPCIERSHRVSCPVGRCSIGRIPHVSGNWMSVLFKFFLMLFLGMTVCVSALAQQRMPEGMRGWWYYIGFDKSGFVNSPHEACRLSALNHFDERLIRMYPADDPKPIYRCVYKNPFGGMVFPYSQTYLACEPGYTATSPGICVKWAEPPRPPSCSGSEAGYVHGNPVALATGAKIQTEIDFAGGPNGTLRIARTYRSVRTSGNGQSAGLGWSFSFDRYFFPEYGIFGDRRLAPPRIKGSFGDGTFFEFTKRGDGPYVSTFDSRESLRSLNNTFDDWALTRRDGSVERYKKVNDKFLLVSLHTKEGVGQFYEYGADAKLAKIADTSARTLNVTWDRNAVASITGATGSVRYIYDSVKDEDGVPLASTELLERVVFYDAAERQFATRLYHYEDEYYRHLLTGITDENGVRFATYAYNASGQAVLSEHAGGVNRHTFAYPEMTKRVITDPLGTQRNVELTYRNFLGLVSSVSQPGGAGCGPGSSKRTYDGIGRLTSSTDFDGKKSCFITDSTRGLLISEVSGLTSTGVCPATATEPIAATSRRVSKQWHPEAELETAVASAKQITRYVYNGQLGADGTVANCAANGTLPNGKPILVLCSKTVQATRDPNGAAGFAAQPDGPSRTWRYHYNAAGQLLKQTGPVDATGQTESVIYAYYLDATAAHAIGDLASTQNATGEVTKYLEYSGDGLVSRIQRPDGTVMKLEYGPGQRLVSSTLESGRGGAAITRYSYDSVGHLTGLTSPDGTTLTLHYDKAQRLTGLTDGAGNRVQLRLDNMGNATRQEIFNASGKIVQVDTQAFDALGRLISFQRGTGTPTTYQYDRAGNLTLIKDALGRLITAEFDSLDRITKIKLPAAGAGKPATLIGYGFDHRDRVVSVTDPRNLNTRYTMDGYEQLVALSSPDTATSLFQYDNAGNMVAAKDGRGVTIEHRYDAAGRVTRSGANTFEYGKDGSSGAGRLTGMTDESGNTTFSYDDFGRLQSKLQTVGVGLTAKKFALEYTYGTSGNATGHVTSMTYPSGNRIEIGYGESGRAMSLALVAPMATKPTVILADIRYSPLGAIQSWRWGDPAYGNFYMREFDANGRLKRYPLGVIGANGTLRTLNYDAADRINSIVHTGAPNASRLDQSYTYDDLDRLTRVDGGGISQGFEYDSNGNRIKARFGASTYANSIHSASNRLMSTTGPVPAKSNAYDYAGNLISDGTAKFTYGTNGRMTSVVIGGVTSLYRYNGFGERVEKAGGAGVRTYYVYDFAGRMVGEYDQTGKAIQETVYLGDLPVAVLKRSSAAPGVPPPTSATDVFSVYADHILTPRVITRLNDARMVWRWDSTDPFGLLQPDETPAGMPKFNYNPRFPGQVFDKETNNHYNYYRDYDPQTGRYIQSDPIGLEGGTNTYGYVGGNPLIAIDPFGLSEIPNPGSSVPGGPWTPQAGQKPGTYQGPMQEGGRTQARYVPSETNGGPKGASSPYWKVKTPTGPWERFDMSGRPLTPDQAHPGPTQQKAAARPVPPPVGIPLWARILGVGVSLLFFCPDAN